MSLVISPNQLAHLYPAFIGLDLNGRIQRLGPSSEKFLTADAYGKPITTFFEVTTGKPQGDASVSRADRVIAVQLKGRGAADGLLLKGSAIRDEEKLMFLVGHDAVSLKSRSDVSLKFSDFAPADSSMELLIALKLHSVMMDEARQLSGDLSRKQVQQEAATLANVAKTRFLATMSHELRTPLNGIIGMTDALTHQCYDATQSEMLRVIMESGDALLAILNDVLDISKIEAQQMDLDPVATDMPQLARDICRLFSATMQEKGLELTCDVQDGFPETILIDAHRTRQCITNLVSNAVKFTEDGGVAVTLSSEPVGERVRVRVTVSDTGIGMSAEAATRIFEPFTQADSSTTREYGGTGLGLSIVSQVAELMDGSVTVQSEPGKGSAFTLVLMADPFGEDVKAAA